MFPVVMHTVQMSIRRCLNCRHYACMNCRPQVLSLFTFRHHAVIFLSVLSLYCSLLFLASTIPRLYHHRENSVRTVVGPKVQPLLYCLLVSCFEHIVNFQDWSLFVEDGLCLWQSYCRLRLYPQHIVTICSICGSGLIMGKQLEAYIGCSFSYV